MIERDYVAVRKRSRQATDKLEWRCNSVDGELCNLGRVDRVISTPSVSL